MAILPYRVHVVCLSTQDPDLDETVAWCNEQWRYTKGATWSHHYMDSLLIDRKSSCYKIGGIVTDVIRFFFQFEEDFVMFKLRWSDRVVKLAYGGQCEQQETS